MERLYFEQGPIRPPSEAQSLLLRVTRNCSWNKCEFCPVYKNTKFERRTVEEVKADIDTIAEIIKTVKELSREMGLGGYVTGELAQSLFQHPDVDHSFASVAAWLYYGTNAVFLQDANNLILKADALVQMLEYLNQKIPGISRITTYARSQTAARKSVDDLKRIRKAGLNRVHIGLESGSDRVLKFVKKGATAEGHIKGGRNIKAAGMELSDYYMPGLGGRKWWKEHSIETARVLNAINPDFIRLRTLHVMEPIPLYQQVVSGEFELRTPDEAVEEIRLFIESLEGITSYVASDHMGNMLQDVQGRLPQDKQRMLDAIDRYLSLDADEKQHYQVGRIMGLYTGVSDMIQPSARQKVDDTLAELKEKFKDGLDDALVKYHDTMMR